MKFEIKLSWVPQFYLFIYLFFLCVVFVLYTLFSRLHPSVLHEGFWLHNRMCSTKWLCLLKLWYQSPECLTLIETRITRKVVNMWSEFLQLWVPLTFHNRSLFYESGPIMRGVCGNGTSNQMACWSSMERISHCLWTPFKVVLSKWFTICNLINPRKLVQDLQL